MNLIITLAAGAPILLVCGLLALRVRATIAAFASIAAAIVVSILWFPIDSVAALDTATTLGPLLLEVVLIILGGVLLAEVLTASGAQATIARWLTDACRDRARVVLLITFGVTPFAESITGFGLGVIVGIPLLRQVGLSMVKSATIALLGLVLVPWGSLAPGTLITAQLGGVDFVQLGVWSAIFTLPVLIITATVTLLLAVGGRGAVRSIPDALITVGTMWLTLIASNLILGPPLAGVVASIGTTAALLLVARIVERNHMSPNHYLGRALLPYGVLILGLLASSMLDRMLPLGAAGRILASPALWLLVTGALAFRLLRVGRAETPALLRSSARRGGPVAFTTMLFLILGGVMAASGTSAHLAEAASQLGGGYLLLAPLIGAVGGYITGSNSASGAMFSASTAEAALSLGADPLTVLATQNVGSSAAIMASPPRVVLALSVAAATEDATRQGTGDAAEGTADETAAGERSEGHTPASAPVTRVVLLATLSISLVLGVCTILFA